MKIIPPKQNGSERRYFQTTNFPKISVIHNNALYAACLFDCLRDQSIDFLFFANEIEKNLTFNNLIIEKCH